MPRKTTPGIHVLPRCHALSDPIAEEMLSDSDAMRRFARVALGDVRIPDKTVISTSVGNSRVPDLEIL